MSWVVDTSVLLDIHLADEAFSRASAECMVKYCGQGLIISPVTHVELASAFDGNAALQEQFLAEVGVEWPAFWTIRDTQAAHDLWAAHIRKKHEGRAAKRPVAECSSRPSLSALRGSLRENQSILRRCL